jgi:hypothetical protein
LEDEDRLRRQHRHALRLLFKFLLRAGIAGPVVEQLENGSLLIEPSWFRERIDLGYSTCREMTAKDVLQVVRNSREGIDKELAFGFEVSKL